MSETNRSKIEVLKDIIVKELFPFLNRGGSSAISRAVQLLYDIPSSLDENYHIGKEKDGNTTFFETTGTGVAQGEATCWDDFAFSVNNLRVNPATSKPDFDQNNVEYLFDGSSTETIVGAQISEHRFQQAPPEWKPHIHWMQQGIGNVVWQLEYKLIPANTIEPATWTTLTTTSKEFEYTSGSIHQISSFSPINMTGYNSTAIHVKVKISRLGADILDTYVGDARFMGFDIHVPIDMLGSRQEFIK